MRNGLVMLRMAGTHWQRRVVHVLDLAAGEAYTAVTPATGGFIRLRGRISSGSRP